MVDVMDIVTPRDKQYPEQAVAAMARLNALIDSDPVLAGAQIHEVLRLVPGRRAIIAGQFAGQPAVFRVSLHPDETTAFAKEWQELCRAQPFMCTGTAQIATPLARSEAKDVIVVARAPGDPLLVHITGLPKSDRIQPVVAAAAWLERYQDASVAVGAIGWKKWFTKAESALEQQTHPELQAVEARVLRRMKTLGRRLDHLKGWRMAIGHGDFHPNNLILGPDHILRGIDLGGSGRIPIYKDMARFLTHMARRGVMLSDARRFGVDATAFDAFVNASHLNQSEAELCLPFMICFETLFRVEHPDMPARRVTHAVRMAKALLADLRGMD